MASDFKPGGVIHTYQKYDPAHFPSPTLPPPDVVSGAFDHLLTFGRSRRLTDEELARAVRLDPSQIPGFGPSIEALIAMLLERQRKILEKYETDTVLDLATQNYEQAAVAARPPHKLRKAFSTAARDQQIYQLERIWYAIGEDRSPFARELVQLIERLGVKYQIDEMAARYDFLGSTSLTVSQALVVKEELDTIEKLLDQLREARESAQIGIIDLEALSEFAEPDEMTELSALQQVVQDHLRDIAERQGLEKGRDGHYHFSPKAYRLFQGKLLSKIFGDLQASRTGRHTGPVDGDGAVEMPQTKPYEFGDSLANMDIPQTLMNTMLRQSRDGGANMPLRLKLEDIEIHRTRNNPKCATVVIMDMSGSMRYDGQYVNVKRMALALDGLIRSEYPGDFLRFIEMYTFGKVCAGGEIAELMPKPVTIHDPWVRLKVDLSDEDVSEYQIHPHFTNIQRSLQMARQLLANQATPNRNIILITDGLPTAHFEQSWLYMLYPPDPRTEAATMREGLLCRQANITINMFLVPSWSQSEEDIRFAHRLAESTTGRVFFTAGADLDRYVVWDYVARKRHIVA